VILGIFEQSLEDRYFLLTSDRGEDLVETEMSILLDVRLELSQGSTGKARANLLPELLQSEQTLLGLPRTNEAGWN
jgi:hypothetical protein